MISCVSIIQWFLVYSCANTTRTNLEFFHFNWKRNPVSSPPPYPVNSNLLSLDWPILDISDTWNHTKYDPLWLASFSQHVFRIHPCCSTYRHFISFYHAMDMLHFVYPFISWWTFALFSLWPVWGVLLWTSCIHFCAHGFCFSGIYLEVKLLSHTISNSMFIFLRNRQTVFQSRH